MKIRKQSRVLVWALDPALEARILAALEGSPYFVSGSECPECGEDGAGAFPARKADVAIVALAPGEGLDRLRALRAATSDMPVVVLLPQGPVNLGLEALEAGAGGVLRQSNLDPAGLVFAVGVALQAGARERELRAARDEAERAASTKSEFLASMSHELRTPIHSIIASTELLVETRLDDEQREYAGTVRSSASILLGLVNDVLDVSRIEAGQLALESIDFDLCAVVEAAVELSALEAQRKGLELAARLPADVPETLRGDPARLRQVLVNLVNNAVKFTHEGEVVVSLRHLAGEGGGELEFSVRDTGIGIPDEKRSLLFQSFSQLDSATNRKYGGTGLGLAISRSLVQMMGGRIGVESGAGQGSRFWFTLPAPAQAGEDARLVPPDFFAGLRVLVVDDNRSVREILGEHLSSWGCTVGEAATGPGALALLRGAAGARDGWQLALLDLRMPGMDGWQLASEIRADPRLGGMRLILLSTLGLTADEAKMKLLRLFNGYVTKPVRRQRLVETVFTATSEDLGLAALPGLAREGEHFPVGSWRILVVDDGEVSRELFRTVLEKAGYSVETAADGAEAMQKLSAEVYDLVFMDVNMPGTTGLDVTRRMRERGIATTVVAVTASAGTDEERRCLASGMNDFLPKPFLRRDLAKMLAKWLAGPRGAGESAAVDHVGVVAETASGTEPAAEGEPAPASGPSAVFDRDAAVATFLGRGDLVDRLLLGLVQRAETGLRALHEAAARQDTEAVRSEAHAIKGAAMNLSAGRLAETARTLERFAREGRVDEFAAAVASLQAALADLSAMAGGRTGETP
jgi:signal transduction histidine kinase/CheY-like chemotaxis protein/HPt (histidine-containing phosphotransfer) domain-containing protein